MKPRVLLKSGVNSEIAPLLKEGNTALSGPGSKAAKRSREKTIGFAFYAPHLDLSYVITTVIFILLFQGTISKVPVISCHDISSKK